MSTIASFTITVGTVSGSAWNTNTAYTNLNLRASPYSSAAYTQDSHLGDGVYKFVNVASGEYKLYNNSTELTKFGIIKIGEDGAVLITGTQSIAGVKTFTDQPVLSAGVKTDTISEKTSAAGVTIDGILLKDDLQTSDIASLSANNSMTGNNSFEGDNTFSGTNEFEGRTDFTNYLPNCAEVPTTDNELVNKAYVDDAVNAISVTPFQESTNVIRLIPGGTQETSKVYTSYAIAQNFCRGYATNNWRFTIEIKGAGTGGVDITATNGAISGNNVFNNYVSLKGENQQIKLQVDDDAFSVTADKVMIENITIARDDNGAGTPSFANFIFKDVYFDFDTASLSFNGCNFRNCFIKNTGSISFTSCKGGGVITTGTLPATVTGWDGVSSSDF